MFAHLAAALLLVAAVLPSAQERTDLYAAAGVMEAEVRWIEEAEARAEQDPRLATALPLIFDAYRSFLAGDPASAVVSLEAAEAALEGTTEPLLGLIASTRSVALGSIEGRGADAVEAARVAIAIGADPEFVAANHLNLAVYLWNLDRMDEYVPACEPLAAWLEADWLANQPGLICINHVAASRFAAGRLEEADRIWTRSAALVAALYGATSAEASMIAGNRGRVAMMQQRYQDAYDLFDFARATLEALGDNNAWNYYPYLADSAVGIPRLDRAEELYRALLAAHEQAYGADSTYVAMDLGSVAGVLQKQGRYDDAEALLARAIAIGEAHEAAEPRHLAHSLTLLAGMLAETGDYPRGAEAYARVLAIQAAAEGDASINVAATQTNYGSLLRDWGRFAEAAVQYESALITYETQLGSLHQYVATALTNLAGLRQSLGDHEAALPMFERAVDIYERTVGPEHEWTATGLNNLGTAMQSAGDYEGAADAFGRASQTYLRILGPDHPWTLAARTNLAEVYRGQERFTEARDEYTAIIAATSKRLGKDHPRVGIARGRLAWVHWWLDENQDAIDQADLGLETLRASLGDFHPTTSEAWAQWAEFNRVLDNRDEARGAAAVSYDGAMVGIVPLLDVTSERERMAMVAEVRDKVDLVLSLYDQPGDELLLYGVMLGWKSIVMRTLAIQRETLLAGREPELAEQLEALAAVRGELATATFAEPDPDLAEAHRAEVAALTQRKERLERSLARASADFEHALGAVEIDAPAICKTLRRDEAVVDYLRFDYLPLVGTREPEEIGEVYLAFVLRGGDCDAPVRVPLGAALPVDTAVAKFRRRVANPAQATAAARHAGELRALVWDPLAEALEGRTRVRIVPDGSLNSVPFAALPAADGSFLVEQFEISYLDSALALIQPDRKSKPRGHLVVGGVAYDEGQALALAEPDTDAAPTLRSQGLRGVEDFGYLANTATEADEVAAALGRGREPVVRLGGADATEAQVRAAAAGKRSIHLATHGFFATGEEGAALEGGARNPMLLSGIVLAGVNDRNATRGDDDGVLTAEEVVSLDLRGTELVTLSACETGLGEVADGEGVMGLRRAFALAGADALVFSLWQVPDAETRELMTGFYEDLSARKRSDPSDALRQAQLALIARLRAETGEAPAFYWAAFVVSGG